MKDEGQHRADRADGHPRWGAIAPRLARASLPGSVINAALAIRHSLRARGERDTARFAALALGLPTLAEWYAVNLDRGLRHHSRPQIAGVPLTAALGWWTITSATHALVDGTLAQAGASAPGRRWATPVGTALVATSLDLVLDPLGLALGLWEWRDGGPYAREIAGPNGRSGIPLGNYAAWLAITGGIAALFSAFSPPHPPPATDPRAAARILLAYYLPAALWALRQHQPKYLLASALFPATVALAYRNQAPRAQ